MILYIPNATINQYVILLERFAFIQELESIELKLDTSSKFCNDISADGTTSILDLIKQFKVKLPSLKDLKLIFRDRDFTFISESIKKKYLVNMASKTRFSKELNQGGDFMNESQIISWIAQEQYIKIDVVTELTRRSKDDICSSFEESLSSDEIICKRVFTLSTGKLEDLICQV